MGDGCYFCDATDEIEEHHILPQRFEGSDAESNVVDVCHECHWKLERLYNKDFWHALGIDDPRATKEKHVICYWDGCREQAVERMTVGNEKVGQAIAYYCEDHVKRKEKGEKWWLDEMSLEELHEEIEENGEYDEDVKRHGVDTDELEYSRETEKRVERLTDHYE